MKKIFSVLSLIIGLFVFGQKIPNVMKTEFSEIGLQNTVISTEGNSLTIDQVLDQYKGKIVVLDLWATWCGDCITGMPKLKDLQIKNNDIEFVYFSMDKTVESWKNGIEKYDIKGHHYFIGNNWKSEFATSIDLNWIPRYLVIDQNGKIANYYSVKADDPKIQLTIDTLRNK